MSDELCACGHLATEHFAFQFNGRPMIRCMKCEDDERRYHAFCPSVPWPTSQGWWWMKSSCPLESDWLVYAMQSNRAFEILIAGTDAFFPQQDFEQRHRWCADGPARFTKLLERNPYESTPG